MTYVSTLPIACPLKPIRASPGTVLWSKLYSRKIFLDHWPVIMFSPAGICPSSLHVLRLPPAQTPFQTPVNQSFPLPSKLLTGSGLSPASPRTESWVAHGPPMREYLLSPTRAPRRQVPLIHGLDRADIRCTPIRGVLHSYLGEKGKPSLADVRPTMSCGGCREHIILSVTPSLLISPSSLLVPLPLAVMLYWLVLIAHSSSFGDGAGV